MRVNEVAAAIQETMESYEVEIDGKVLPGMCNRCHLPLRHDSHPLPHIPVKAIRNLSGHSINRYQIHGGKSVGLVKNDDETKMEEGEYFAIETFGSTGRGFVVESVCIQVRNCFSGALSQFVHQGDCSHYARRVDAPRVKLR